MSEVIHEENEPLHEALHEVWLPLHEAAAALGISPRAVQLRAEKGKLQRERQDGRVVFRVPAPRSVHEENEVAHEAVHEESEPLHAENEVVHEAVFAASREFVTHLETEVGFLREQLLQRDVAESELRRLLLSRDMEIARLQQENRLLLLADPIPYEVVQDAPQTAQEGRTEAQAGAAVHQPQESTEGAQGQAEAQPARKWWEFWK